MFHEFLIHIHSYKTRHNNYYLPRPRAHWGKHQLYITHLFKLLSTIIVLFVETPRKFITAVINLRGVSTNKTIICFIAMQTYKELILSTS
jgi:hypothetical protein